MRRLAGAVGAAAALVPALTGCGLGAGRTPGSVQLAVTSEFGSRVLSHSGAPKVSGQETVMSLLMRNYRVGTRYGGGFVQSIDGLAGDSTGGRPVDWFYYVNGVQAPKGAAATTVHAGDRVWWDRHDWSQAETVPAVVGSFPAPFLDGIAGKRYPLRVECASATGPACRAVRARLRDLGATVTLAAISGAGAPQTLRVLVGPWSQVGSALGAQGIVELEYQATGATH